MESDVNKSILDACKMLLRPIASMLLKCGMTWKEFSELSKAAFVQMASNEYGIKGRPTNISRVSILTGISRKEVKHQRDLLEKEEPIFKGKTTDATRVLSGWHQDPLYTDDGGQPLLLAEGGSAPSFEKLCARYAGDIPMQTMLKELLKTGAVERTVDGLLGAIRRYYQPAVHDEENLRWAVSLIRDLTETMNNNVFLDKTGIPRFGRKADNDCIPPAVIPDFKQFLEQRGQIFLEEVDDWLTAHVVKDNIQLTECVRIGVGLFAIEDRDSKEQSK